MVEDIPVRILIEMALEGDKEGVQHVENYLAVKNAKKEGRGKISSKTARKEDRSMIKLRLERIYDRQMMSDDKKELAKLEKEELRLKEALDKLEPVKRSGRSKKKSDYNYMEKCAMDEYKNQ